VGHRASTAGKKDPVALANATQSYAKLRKRTGVSCGLWIARNCAVSCVKQQTPSRGCQHESNTRAHSQKGSEAFANAYADLVRRALTRGRRCHEGQPEGEDEVSRAHLRRGFFDRTGRHASKRNEPRVGFES